MAATLFYAVAIAALTAAVVRARRADASGGTPALRAYVALLTALGLTFAVMATPSQAWVNRFVPDLFKLMGNCFSLIAVFCGEALILHTSYPGERATMMLRFRLAVLLAVLGVLAVMFFWPHPVTLVGSFDAYLAIDPTLVVYTLAYSLFVGAASGDIAIMTWRFSRHTARYLRAGLRVIAMAGVGGVIYAAAKMAIVIEHLVTNSSEGAGDEAGVCHAPFGSPACAVVVGIPGAAVLALVIGVLLASGATHLDSVHRRVDQFRAYRRIEPLWRHLHDAFPEISRMPNEPRVITELRGVEWRLVQRLVQTRDGLLLLAPHRNLAIPNEVRTTAQQTGSDDHDAVVEAAQIAAALTARAAGTPPAHDPPDPPTERLDDIDAEITWLQRVSRAFAHSPVVAAYRSPSVEENHDRQP